MKTRVLLMIYVLLLSLGLFLGIAPGRAESRTATIEFDETPVEKGDNDESQDNLTLVFGAGPSAERLRDAEDPARG